ncbi:Metallo-dependent phosphatase-like protein [Ochromonadaceae sp. CCMP2298]|nr:Metallo-dependent phosphatase-like protein [Ochromonadaceae sp. CCMP2298]
MFGKALVSLALLGAICTVFASEPVPDTSELCMTCEGEVGQLQATWTNETTVAEVLKEMQHNCRAYPYLKQKACDKIAEVLVQIPPALFHGMEDLAWPIPEAMCALLRQCTVNCCAQGAAPEQLHLSLSLDGTQMGITWVTVDASSSVVQYGTTADLQQTVTGILDTYTSDGWVGVIHRAMMVQLLPNTEYFYRVGDPDKSPNPWSEVYSFKTFGDSQGPQEESVTFAVLADMDYGEASDYTVADLVALVDAGVVQGVVQSGDISYADGYEPHWDVFFNKIQPIVARVPMMVTPGNHEFWFNFVAYKHRFTMPSAGGNPGSGSGDNMYYSWNAPHAHFIACNSESPLDTAYFSDAQLDWMRADLGAVDRASVPWVLAHFHRPLYCAGDGACLDSDGKGGAKYIQGKTEDIFYENHVNLVFYGHVHSYQRTYPVYNETVAQFDYSAPTAPTYLLQGASGNREGNKGSYPPLSDQPQWVASQEVRVGYGLLTITATTLQWKYYASSNSTSPAVLLDTMTITK